MVEFITIDFVALCAIIIVSAILTLEVKEIVYALFFFDVFILGIAGILLILNSGFLSMFELTVYAGAIVVIVIFAVMLTKRGKTGKEIISHAKLSTKIRSISLPIVILALMIAVISSVSWITPTNIPEVNSGEIFTELINNYDLAFLGTSLLLATALIGGVGLLRTNNRDKKQSISSHPPKERAHPI